MVNAQEILRDIVVTVIYVVFGVGQIFLGCVVAAPGQERPPTPELETSAYGRPLVRKA